MTLEIRPVTLRDASAFVAEHHRHHKPPRGHKFSVAVYRGADLVGVAIAGRPVSRALDDGLTLEVTRTCTLDGSHDDAPARYANSALYGAVWRAGRAMGYTRAVTYTQGLEGGASLRAAGWAVDAYLDPRGSWRQHSRALAHIRDAQGSGGERRVRWAVGQPRGLA